MKVSGDNTKKVYVTAIDSKRRGKARCLTVQNMTPFQFITLIRRIACGELLVVDAKTREPIAA